MQVPGNKKLVCITGSVWTGSRSAPRRLLVEKGFRRPLWFTTGRRITDGEYKQISPAEFHLAAAKQEVLVHMEYGSDFVGILNAEFEKAMSESERGVLVVCHHEIAARLAELFSQITVFTLKDDSMEISDDLEACAQRGQLHRIDVNVLQPGAWSEVDEEILTVLGIPHQPFVM